MRILLSIIALFLVHHCFAQQLRQDRETVTGRIAIEDSGQALAVTVFVTNNSTNSVEITTGSRPNPFREFRLGFSFPRSESYIEPSATVHPEFEIYLPVTNVLKPRLEWKIGTFIIAKPNGWDHTSRLQPQLILYTPGRNLEYIVKFTDQEEAAPEFDITKVEKAKDKVTVEVQPERVAFAVISSDGIGKFSVALKSGRWPRDLSIMVNRKGLESFGLVTERIWANGAVKSATNYSCFFTFRNNKGEFDDQAGAGSLRIRLKETKDGLELTFPPYLLSDSKQFSFGWIDAFRR